jgi:hypothetical protein
MRPGRGISPIAATVTVVLSMRSSAPKTTLNPKCGPRACPRESGGRTCHRGYQAGVRLCQGALSRAQKERASPARGLCARQSVHRAPPSIALRGGVICRAQPLLVADAIDVTPITTPLLPHRHRLRQFQWRISTRGPLFRPSLGLAVGQVRIAVIEHLDRFDALRLIRQIGRMVR